MHKKNLTSSQPAKPVLRNKQRTLAVLGASMATPYNTGIYFGAYDYARSHGYNFLGITGGPPNNPDVSAQARAKVFDVVDPELVDGLVVSLGTLGRYMQEEDIARFLLPYRGKPIATIGTRVEGCISVKVEIATGMRQLLTHLIEDHGYRRIAFASGPIHHTTSNDKLAAYIDTLAHYGIAYDPDYVVHGELNRNTSNWCAELLFDQRKLQVDAIVSVNDNQAFAIVDSLKERGLRIPEDIAVTGSMNILECSVSSPSLTTIREPMYEQGWMAAKAVIDTLEGRAQPEQVTVSSELVIRHSCGCSSEQIHKFRLRANRGFTRTEVLPPSSRPQDVLLKKLRDAAHSAIQSLNAAPNEDELKHLAKLFAQVRQPADIGPALRVLEDITDRHLREDVMTAWLAIIPALQHDLYARFQYNSDQEALEALVKRFESLLFDVSQKAFSYRDMLSEKYINAFRELSIFMNASFDVEVIRRLIIRDLGAQECFINLYQDKDALSGPVKNVLAVHNKQLVSLSNAEQHFPPTQLLPAQAGDYAKPFALFVLPMSFRAEPIGYIVVDAFDRRGLVFENFQALLSGAMKTELQIQQLKEAEEKFSDIALSASDWLWEVDADCRYVFCSDGVERVLGYSADEMIGRSLFDFVLPSETNYLDLVKNYLIPYQLELSNMEHINTHKLGHDVTLIISGKPIVKDGQLIGYRGAFKDTTEIKAQENKIRQLAYHDTLTGLPNRTLFNDRLHMSIAGAEREPKKFAVLFLDLDRFKNVNDTLGHDAGDLLLQTVAKRLLKCIREADTLARLGGDEFTIILSHVERDEDVVTIAQRIVAELCVPVEVRGHQVFITTSVGIAIYPHDGNSAQALVKNADKAMYKAKEQGKNQFVFYDEQMGEKSNKRLKLEAVLHKALKDDSFQLHYQPQVGAESCKIVGTEALIRLATPELGPISPMEFISLAEEIGLIDEIGLWVFKTACKQAFEWEKKGYNQRVAINVSGRQLKNSYLAPTFINIAKEIGVSPHLIEIEITENAVIDNEITAKEILDAFSEFGFKIAIDDFGTGYSSLSSLKKFPIDTVKIDRSFINDSVQNLDSANLVSAIIQIAKSLRLNVIAEGVETSAQLELLRSMGCQEIQGYLFSKPMSAELVEGKLFKGVIIAGST